jgi:hypothetical protein
MNTVRIAGTETRVMTMANMKTGDIAVVIEGTYKGEIVMKFGDGRAAVIASLSHPLNFWQGELDKNSNVVRILGPGEAVNISVGV